MVLFAPRRRRRGRPARGSPRRARACASAHRDLTGVCALPFSGRTLSVESQPRAEPLAGPAVFYLRWFYFAPRRAGGVAAELGGRRGARGHARARIGNRHRRVLALTFGPDFIHWRRSGESWPRVWPGRRLFFLRNAPAAAAAWPISYGVASARDCGSLASSRKVQHSEGSFIRLDRAQRTRTSSAFSSLGSAPRGRAAKTLGHAPSQRRQAPAKLLHEQV